MMEKVSARGLVAMKGPSSQCHAVVSETANGFISHIRYPKHLLKASVSQVSSIIRDVFTYMVSSRI